MKHIKRYQLPFRYGEDEQQIMELLKEVWGYENLAAVVRRSIREAGQQVAQREEGESQAQTSA